MDMSSSSSSTDNMTNMRMVFTSSHMIPFLSDVWTPRTSGQFAGSCIFFVLLAITFRCLLAAKHVAELHWSAKARNRRYVVTPETMSGGGMANTLEHDPDAKEATLVVSAQGVEERVRVVKTAKQPGIPFRLSVDVPRACLTTLTVGVGYLIMLGVMTMSVGYFMSLVAGTFIGELAVGRYTQYEEH